MFSEQVTSEKTEFMQNQITSKKKDGTKGKIGKNLLSVMLVVKYNSFYVFFNLISSSLTQSVFVKALHYFVGF